MKPFIRWVGGKRRMFPEIRALIGGDPKMTHYYEPFVGGGAVFFEFGRLAEHSEISDINIHLMSTYAAVKHNADLVIDQIKLLKHRSYTELRKEFNDNSKIAQCKTAALFLMLNHLNFNGLYRVNKQGLFNVPIGKHGSTKLGTSHPRTMDDFDYQSIEQASTCLRHTTIRACPFGQAMRQAVIDVGHTLVFCDPPYLMEFSSYDKSGFTKAHHAELAHVAGELRDKGAYVIVCGSDNPESHQIYGTPAHVVELNRTVGAGQRGKAREALYVFAPVIDRVMHPVGHSYVEGRINPKPLNIVKMG